MKAMEEPADNDLEYESKKRQEKVENLTVKYFREIASYPLLDIRQEKDLAQQIIDLEQKQWATILSNPIRASEFASILGSEFPELRPGLKAVYAGARAYRKQQGKMSKKQWGNYHLRIASLTCLLRNCDIDRIYLDEFVDVLIGPDDDPHAIRNAGPFVRKIYETRDAIRSLKNFFIASTLRLVISIAKKH